MDVSNNALPSTTIGSFASNLALGPVYNGYFAFTNNPDSGSAFAITTNIATLVGRGWTVVS